ncbi:hypothetical protein [Acidomonas methanolica]|uniref:hypothetical protein n=1 Tax=Acidomonas methanolica TaxID=437 RepID=UPI00211A0E01|nr:hypothetical protein [Acidomonas methanolica]MCQ9154072.1 hypothetical protein [Acidomonas methanolica]
MSVSFTEIEAAVGAVGRMGATAPVVIGGMVLTGLEVPDELVVGGQQQLTVHRLLGGGRVIDVLGNDPDRLILRGRFVGPQAQARARMVERMRAAGAAVAFSAAGLSCQVWIAQFAYSYQARGAVCAYMLVLERADLAASAAVDVGGAISGDVGGALSGLSGVVSDVSGGVYTLAGQVGTIVGQVTPVAALLGAGGAVATVTNALAAVNGAAQAGVDLAGAPSVVSTLLSGLSAAGSGLSTLLGQTGANLEGIVPGNGASLEAVTKNAGLASAAADAAGLVNRSAANVALAGGVTPFVPVG